MEPAKLIEEINNTEADREGCADYLDFTPGVPIDLCKQLVQRGWWHVLPVAQKGTSILALRVLPDQPWPTWPVVRIFGLNRAITVAPDLARLPAFSVFQSIFTDEELIQDTWDEWDYLLELVDTLPPAMGRAQQLNRHREALETALQTAEHPDQRYRLFWERAYPEPDLLTLTRTIERIQTEQAYLPDPTGVSDPVVANRWAHVLGSRAYQLFATEMPAEELSEQLLLSWRATPGIDAEALLIQQRPSETSDSDIQDFQTAEVLLTGPGAESADSVWWEVARSLVASGRKNYTGADHLVAAREVLAAEERTEAGWILTVGAAYWSGINGKSANTEALQLALQNQQLWHPDAAWVLEHHAKLLA